MASLTTSGLLKTPHSYSQTPANYRQYPPFAHGKHQVSVSLKRDLPGRAIRASASNLGPSTSSSPGLYSAQKFELTIGNVDLVLEDVRPYLIADGGNVDVVSVEDGVVSLKLVGGWISDLFELNGFVLVSFVNLILCIEIFVTEKLFAVDSLLLGTL